MTILTVTQPYSATWITLFKPYMTLKSQNMFCNMSVSHAKNVCQSQISIKHFFLYVQLIDNVFLFDSPDSLDIETHL